MTTHFGTAKEARLYHTVLTGAGYTVTPVKGTQASGHGVFKVKACWTFETDHSTGDAICVIAHLMGRHGSIDRDWLSRQWPEVYRRISAVMCANYAKA